MLWEFVSLLKRVEMGIGTLMILVAIGLAAGMMSGFVGIGGGVIMVPALIYFMGLRQMEAQGTSLAVMLPPIGILAFQNYYSQGYVDLRNAMVIALFFIIGGYFGSKLALKLPENTVRLIFGLVMVYVAGRMVWKSVAEMIQPGG